VYQIVRLATSRAFRAPNDRQCCSSTRPSRIKADLCPKQVWGHPGPIGPYGHASPTWGSAHWNHGLKRKAGSIDHPGLLLKNIDSACVNSRGRPQWDEVEHQWTDRTVWLTGNPVASDGASAASLSGVAPPVV